MKEYIEINRSAYDSLAKEYAFRSDNIGKYAEKPEFLGGALYKYAPPSSDIKVLEIGPGAGQILEFFEKQGCHTTGVELSSKMCDLCKQKSPQSEIINANIEEVKFSYEQFDLIYMGAIIHLFPLEAEQRLMESVYKWLKPNGYIFINTTCNESSYEGYYYKKDYSGNKKRFRRYWSENDFEAFVIDCGFSIIERLYTEEKDKNKKWVAYIGKKEI